MCCKARVKKCGGCGLKCLTSGIRLRSPAAAQPGWNRRSRTVLPSRNSIYPYLYLTKKYPPRNNGGLLLLLS